MSNDSPIIIEMDNVWSRIVGYLPDEAYKELVESMSYRRIGDERSKKVEAGTWDGIRKCFIAYSKSFPTGLVGIAAAVLRKHGLKIKYDDIRQKPERDMFLKFEMDPGRELYYFQREAVDVAKKIGRGVFSMPTGSGKTLTFTAALAEIGVSPTLVFVPSLLLLEQTADEIREHVRHDDGSPVEVGIVGDGRCDIREITVMTVQTAITAYDRKYDDNKGSVRDMTEEEILRKYVKPSRKNSEDPDATEDLSFLKDRKMALRGLIETARMIVADECHRAASSIWQEVLNFCGQAYYRFAFSGTAYREDGTGILINASFGKTLVDIPTSKLIREGYLIKPYILMVEAPDIDGDFDTFRDERDGLIRNCHERNVLIAKMAEEAAALGPVLILVSVIPHGKAINKLLPGSLFVAAKDGKKKKDQAIADLLSGKLPYLIATPIADEGLDLVSLKTLIMADGGKSSIRLRQRVGRTLRKSPGKSFSLIIDFLDHGRTLRKHSNIRRQTYLSESEFEVYTVKGGKIKRLPHRGE